jgi:FK506-binding protein 4/5
MTRLWCWCWVDCRPNATLEFEVELLSWTKKQKVTDNKTVMKEVETEGEGYNKPNDGATVTCT